jgi:ABC-2 type transport system ATP-binding protein
LALTAGAGGLATGDDLRLDGVGKRYGVRLPWVVRDVHLEIGPGALVRLEGRNGTGKSTLLRVIAGVSAPSKGSVTGRPVTGYVPERFPPSLPFSARDYLSHVGRVHGMTSGELAERIQYCLDRLGGWEFADVPLRNMSKGMCQKVAVAQALLPPSGLLVLDEAWTGLDVEAKGALDEVVTERLADGGSVVYVDHDPQRLAQLDAQRWRIEEGQARPARGDGATAAPVPAGGAFGVVGPGETGSDPGPAEGAAAEAVAVLIEVAGYPDGGPDPGGLPGVLSAQADDDHWLVRAAPQESGAVLRALLAAGDAVHVLELRKPEARP